MMIKNARLTFMQMTCTRAKHFGGYRNVRFSMSSIVAD
jgi:hypothetical protein